MNDQTVNSPYMPPPEKPKKKVWPWILGIGGIILFIIIVSIIASSDSSPSTTYKGSDYVAVLHIEGAISSSEAAESLFSSGSSYSQSYVLSTIEDLKNDARNKGILLYIDSPGGELYAVDEVYCALEDYKEATGRPIYAYCAAYAASGGYYLAATAEKIYANAMCTTGSIGVTYGYHFDLTGLAEKLGITVTTIASDDNKSMGGYFSEMTEEQQAILKSQIDEYYDRFIEVIVAGRGLEDAYVRSLADGRTYTAKQALANRLIDGICGSGDIASIMSDAEGFDPNISYVNFTYTYQAPDILSMLADSNESGALTYEMLKEYIDTLSPVHGFAVYYMGY